MSTQSENHQATNPGHILDRFLREPEVLRLIGVSKMTLRRWEAQGRFPKRCKIGPNTVAWRESAIHDWLANGGASSSEMEAA